LLSDPAAAGTLPAAAADRPSGLIRIATFNCSLNRASLGALRAISPRPTTRRHAPWRRIIQRVRPDVLLLQEFDYRRRGGVACAPSRLTTLARRRTARGHRIREFLLHRIEHRHAVGFDLNHDGVGGGGDDALGFGEFPGQYAHGIASRRFPIDAAHVRTFRKFLWRDMPGALLPPGWYSPEAAGGVAAVLEEPLGRAGAHRPTTLHLLASHPTPPAFDGPEDRNGCATTTRSASGMTT
jgi:hypothetical protein